MNRLQELLDQIKQQITTNNSDLTSEDTRLQDLSTSCENIAQSLTQIEQVLDQINKFSSGIEVAPEDLANSLRELNLTQLTGESLKTKLEQILKLASDGNQELVNKIKDTEKELEQILFDLQRQTTIIANYQARITQLETKIKANESQARDLQIRAGLIGAIITSLGGSLVVLMARF
jgi:chromosome segregation ATPase